MRRFALGSVLLAVAAGLIFTHAKTLGLQAAWPLAAGFALAPLGAGRRRIARTAVSVAVGVALGVGVFAAVSYWMPFIPMSFGLVTGIAVAVMGLAAWTVPSTFSMPAMLLAFGVFYGSYESTWVADRGGFRGDSAAAAASVVLALLGGILVSTAISGVLDIESEERMAEIAEYPAAAERPARARVERERRIAAGGEGM